MPDVPTNERNTHLGLMLERYRLGRCMSQNQFADAFRLTSADIGAYGNGAKRIPSMTLVEIARLHEGQLSTFFGDIE